MQKKLLFHTTQLQITVHRLCHELIENHGDFSSSVIIGIQPRGIFLAQRLTQELEKIIGSSLMMGHLDITFYRDDFRKHDKPLKPNATQINFIVEGKKVIIVDDVLYTGRTIRAALDALNAFGRPEKVELLALIDRLYTRDLPIQPDYTGKQVNTLESQRILVEWQEQGFSQDGIWLVG